MGLGPEGQGDFGLCACPRAHCLVFAAQGPGGGWVLPLCQLRPQGPAASTGRAPALQRAGHPGRHLHPLPGGSWFLLGSSVGGRGTVCPWMVGGTGHAFELWPLGAISLSYLLLPPLPPSPQVRNPHALWWGYHCHLGSTPRTCVVWGIYSGP
jgi:hypothetical protein